MDLKNSLRTHKISFGSWLNIGDGSVAEIMASSGFDWLVIDMEHSAITLDMAQDLIRIIGLAGVLPLVRVGKNDPILIKRVMDAGACGVIVPMVNTKSDAMNAVRAVKYPPLGSRGVGLARAQGYGLSFSEYRKSVNKESIVIVQIEHIEAINNLEAILSTDGVDGSIIGPYDLSASLGLPGKFDDKRVKKAISDYERICKKMNKPMGFHVVEPEIDRVKELRERGYTFLAVGIDMLYLGLKARETLREIKR